MHIRFGLGLVIALVGCGGGTLEPGPAEQDAAAAGSGGAGGTSVSSGSGGAGGDVPEPPISCGQVEAGSRLPGEIELGHTSKIWRLSQSGDRLVSSDDARHWVLWDLGTRGPILEGDGVDSPEIAGSTVALTLDDLFTVELRSAIDGELLATISLPGGTESYASHLSTDGSYLFRASDVGLSVWSSADGSLLFNQPGDYHDAVVLAEPGTLRIGRGPAGASVIEEWTLAGELSLSPPFAGEFAAWFTDGVRFLTESGDLIRIYSKDAGQELVETVITMQDFYDGRYLGGVGDYFWSWTIQTPPGLDVYSMATPDAPAAHYDIASWGWAFSFGTTMALMHSSEPVVDLVHLDPGGITKTTVAAPIATSLSQVAGDAANHWSVGGEYGVVYDDRNFALASGARPLSCGAPLDVVGAPTGRAAIGFAMGTLVLDVDSQSQSALGWIPLPASRLSISADGALLAATTLPPAVQGYISPIVDLFSLPDGAKLHEWPVPASLLSMSSSGNRLALLETAASADASHVIDLASWGTVFAKSSEFMLLSPDGKHSVASDMGMASAILDESGTPVASVPGHPVAWLDDDRLLLQVYGPECQGYCGSRIYDTKGNLLASPELPYSQQVTAVSPTEVYVSNAIIDIETGKTIWQGPQGATLGAVAGGMVVYSQDHRLVITTGL